MTTKRRHSRSVRRRRLQILLLILRCLACAMAAGLLATVGQTFFKSGFAQATQQDNQSPSLWGVRNRQLYVGDSLAYLEGVSAVDAIDPEPVITVDNSRVDLSTPGTYSVIYTATDASGNQCSEEASVTVLELPEGWASAEDIEEAFSARISESGVFLCDGKRAYNKLIHAKKCEKIVLKSHQDYNRAYHLNTVNGLHSLEGYAAPLPGCFQQIPKSLSCTVYCTGTGAPYRLSSGSGFHSSAYCCCKCG